MKLTRRRFLANAAAVGSGLLGLRALAAQSQPATAALKAGGYGDLVPDPRKILDLPKGFAYKILSRMGEEMDDGLLVPGNHDGMAAFPGPDGTTILVRNHELRSDDVKKGAFGPKLERLGKADLARLYDAGRSKKPGLGGTTTLVFDTKKGELVRHFMSLAGTWRNCAGGPTPWGSWVTCEETIQRAKGDVEKDHGYCFEVPARAEIGLADPAPIKAMGRFNHEAIAVDPKSGAVYETEDRGGDQPTGKETVPKDKDIDLSEVPGRKAHAGLFYRYLPAVPGQLAKGGRLQALKIRDRAGADTSNRAKDAPKFAVGQSFDVGWVDLDGVHAPNDDLRHRGFAKGAALFSRGEGLWYGKGSLYFACTDGGVKKKGQVWRYTPSPNEGTSAEESEPGRLELFIQPEEETILDRCDNIAFAPSGDLIICEDGSKDQFVLGVTPQGKLYRIAKNALGTAELAGGCFSPDGSTLFFNIQRPGLTFAITGPWSSRQA
jgi:hypothetical protein